ncbi:MAG: acyl-CoA dehydrogenase family protein [Pseudomonas sp.]
MNTSGKTSLWKRGTLLASLFTAASLLFAGAAAAETTVRIGFQKSSTLITLLRSQGTLERALDEQGVKVSWHEFPNGLPLLEALNVGNVDFSADVADTVPVFAQAAGARLVYVAQEAPSPTAQAILVHGPARQPCWPASTAASPREDGFIHLRLGDLWTQLQGATALAESAAQELQRCWDAPEPTALERGALATHIAEAKLLGARAALNITSQIFETMGARATSARYGFDRFWRNVRVHTLHDPLDHKQKDIGRWLLTGEHPLPSNYS